jgi:hypothetical protein
VQRFYLLLGNPTLALVITLEGLLFGAGVGSLISSRMQGSLRRPVITALIILAALLVAQALLYPLISGALLQTDLTVRIVAVLALTLPLGLLIGIPFPSGLRMAGRVLPTAVPTLWGLNAMAAVLGSVVAAAVAVAFGFQIVLLLGAALYVLAALMLYVGKSENAPA